MNKEAKVIYEFEMDFKKSFCWRSNISNDNIISAWKRVWILEARGPFLESPDNFSGRKAVLCLCFTLKIKVSIILKMVQWNYLLTK